MQVPRSAKPSAHFLSLRREAEALRRPRSRPPSSSLRPRHSDATPKASKPRRWAPPKPARDERSAAPPIVPVRAKPATNLGATCLYQCCTPCATYWPPGLAAVPTAVPAANCCPCPTCCPSWDCAKCSCFYANCGNPCSCVCCGGAQPVQLMDPDPAMEDFGNVEGGMAVSSTHFAVSADGRFRGTQRTRGAVYIYDRQGNLLTTISAPDDVFDFGYSIAMNDKKIAINAEDEQGRFGRVFLYNIDGSGREEVPRPADALDVEFFGFHGLEMSDTHLAIANSREGYENKAPEHPEYGAVYLYQLHRDGSLDGPPTRITGAETPSGGGEYFGYALGLNEDYLAVAGYYMKIPDAPSQEMNVVYLLRLSDPLGGAVGEVRGTAEEEFAEYSWFVRMTDKVLAVSAPKAAKEQQDYCGAIYLYNVSSIRGSQPTAPNAVLWGNEGEELGYYGVGLNDHMVAAAGAQLYIWNPDGTNRAMVPPPEGANPDSFAVVIGVGKAGLVVYGGKQGESVAQTASAFLYSPTS